MNELLHVTTDRLGGVVHRRELLAAGCSRHDVDDAWRSGTLQRIRHGLYGRPDLPEPVVRAARVGGVLAGSSALVARGAWRAPRQPLVVSVDHNARDLRDPDDAGRRLGDDHPDVQVLRDRNRLGGCDRVMVTPSTAAAQALLHPPGDLALSIAVVDSALRLRPEDRPRLADVARLLRPGRARELLRLVDARAESGTESVVRVRLREAGVGADVQVWVSGRYRVDLLVDGWLVIECTSWEFHASPQQYADDRRRTVALTTAGYVVLEVTYRQVFEEWETVLAAVRHLLATARPRRMPR